MKRKLLGVVLIGLLMAAGLVMVGCIKPGDNCPGSGACVVTISQGSNGLYVDTDSPQSCCGKGGSYDSNGNYKNGCVVESNIDGSHRTYGKHGCDCE